MSERDHEPTPNFELTLLQEAALYAICERYSVAYQPEHYRPTFDLPEGWVAGWVGGIEQQKVQPTIYVGCSPEGDIHS
jgi:hypothetical protein